jgi:hypothetical protein
MFSKVVFVGVLVSAVLIIPSAMPAVTWYVDDSVVSSGDGTSWASAFQKIQEGIDAASNGDTVIVGEGTYVENIQFKGKNIVLTSTDPLAPDVIANTVIDGNQAGSVVTLNGTEDESCVLSGFTITRGEAELGGGVYGGTPDRRSHATIENNTISHNSAERYGGGLYACDGVIQKNTLTENFASRLGGGMRYCDGTIRDNVISNNSAGSDGGAMFECNGTIQNNTIAGNSAGVYAGGLSLCGGTIQDNIITRNSAKLGAGLSDCDGIIQNNIISDNAAMSGGGLLGCHGAIQNNTITRNSATEWGGGLDLCHGVIENNAISGNSAEYNGGGLRGCHGMIQNNTIIGNSARIGGGVCDCRGVIRNCIIWGNSAPDGPQVYGSAIPTYSCIEGWTAGGTGNISTDPLLVQGAGGDYRLQPDSPCIDSGVNYYWFARPLVDLDGNCRLYGVSVDLGCYEYGASPDTDGDLLDGAAELAAGTNLNLDDTDGDGLRDGFELLRATDPLERDGADIINVPSDAPTIQQAICLAAPGDQVVVAPGTYHENIYFCGGDVILRSSNPRDAATVASTIIDGGGYGPCVWFAGTESERCILSGFTIRNGNAAYGGGVYGSWHSKTHATIENNIITGNRADGGGGLYDCFGTIQNNVVSGNSAINGGGLDCCFGTIQNNVVSGNSAVDGGGLQSCLGTIRNNTIVGNSAAWKGGGLCYCQKATISNCIIWGNGAQLYECSLPTYCCIEGWTGGGEGNISGNPLFVDVAGKNYRLSANSACIDTGNNENWMSSAVDLDGNPRIFFGKSSPRVDMGAYEYGSWPFRITGISETPSGEGQITWNSRPGDPYAVWSCFDLSTGGWIKEASVASQGPTTFWTDVSTSGQKKFYRIEMK